MKEGQLSYQWQRVEGQSLTCRNCCFPVRFFVSTGEGEYLRTLRTNTEVFLRAL